MSCQFTGTTADQGQFGGANPRGDLWGLLVANHCEAPRQWQQLEINLLTQLAAQVGIAIQQSELYHQVQTELQERKRAEESLQEANMALEVQTEELRQQNEELVITRRAADSERQRYRDLFDFAPDGYLVTDAAGIVQEANRAAAALLAVPQGYLVGKPLSIFVPEAERRTFLTRLAELHQVQNWEVNLQPQRGLPFPVAITVAAVGDHQDNLSGLRWLVRDMTERKRTEQKIREQAALLDVTTDAILVQDLQGQVLFWNKGAEHLYVWQAEEAVGKNVNQLLYRSTSQLEDAQETVLQEGEWQGNSARSLKPVKKLSLPVVGH